MYVGGLKPELCDGPSMSEAQLRELWRFRASVMPHRADADLGEDWRVFSRFVSAARWVQLGRDRQGALRCSVVMTPVEAPDHLFLDADYGYVDLSWRGRWEVLAVWGMLIGRALVVARGRALYFGGVGYPAAAMGIEKLFPSLMLWGDAAVADPIAARHLAMMHERAGGQASGPAWVTLFTKPYEPPAWWHDHAARAPVLVRYLALNPDWRLGRGVPMIARIRARHLVDMARRAVRRGGGRGEERARVGGVVS